MYTLHHRGYRTNFHHCLGFTRGHQANIQSAVFSAFIIYNGFTCKIGVRCIKSRSRELCYITIVQGGTLLFCPANSSRRSNDFRTDTLLLTQIIYSRFKHRNHSTERSRYKMQLVLNNQFGSTVGRTYGKERTYLFLPSHHCKLVHRSKQECGRSGI